MSRKLIACPHCGFSKDVPADSIPKGTVKVNCPKCKQAFMLQGNVKDAAPSPETRQAGPEAPRPAPIAKPVAPAAPVAPPVQAEPSAPPEARRPYSVDLSEIEAEIEGVSDDELETGKSPGPRPSPGGMRPPAPKAQPAPAPKAGGTGGGLSDISDMFGAAWEIYKARAVTLLVLTLLMTLVPVVIIGLGAGGAALLASASLVGAGVVAFVGVVAGLAGAFWVFAALLSAIIDDGLGIKDALGAGRYKLWPMFWVMTLTAFMVIGGYLFFIIPGIVFSVWFFFAIFILMDQDGRGVSALLASKEYVKGHWWGVFGRLLLLGGLSNAAGLVPFVGPLLSFLLWPYTMVAGYLVYSDLKAAKGEAEFTYSTGEKAKLVATGAFGFVLIPLLITAFLFSYANKLGMSVSDFLAMEGMGLHLPFFGDAASGLTGGLMDKDPEVRQAYADYRKALLDGDMDELKAHIAKDKAKDIEGPGAALALEMAKAMAPGNVTVVDSSVDGDTATLTLQAEVDDGTLNGTANMIREDGGWKLDSENWEMNVVPPTLKLKGGKGAPDVEPLAAGYLSAPGMFGMGTAQPFSRGKDDPPKELITLTGHAGEVTGVAFTQFGQIISSSYGDYTVRMWDTATGTETASFKMENRPTGMAVTPDGSTVILADAYQNVTFLPVSFGAFGDATVVSGGIGNSAQVAVSPNGKLAATASSDKRVTIWDVQTRKLLRTIETPEPMRSVSWSPSGDILAAGDGTNKFSLWDLRKGEGRTYVVSKVDSASGVAAIDISPDSKYIATGHMDTSITIWDAKKQEELLNFYVTDAATWDVQFSPDSKLLATSHQDGSVRLWEPATAIPKGTLKGHTGAVRCMAFSQDGSLLVTGGEDNVITVWGYDLAAASGMGAMQDMGEMTGTVTTTSGDETVYSPDSTTVSVGPGFDSSTVMAYIYSINYKGMVKINGKEFYDIKGEKDMNYNYSGGADNLAYGKNTFEVDYQALPDSWMTELKLKVYNYDFKTGKEVVFAEWKIDDKGGKRRFELEVKE